MSRRLFIFVSFTAAYFLSYFFRSANAVIAPDLSAELALDAGQLGLMTSLFFAAFAAVQVPLGVALDRWGARWVTPGLMLTAVVGSALFAVSPSFGLLALGRALIGVGMAGVLMGSLKIFSQWYPADRFATVSGLLVGIGSMGALIAATPLAWLNETVGWRTVFWMGAGATLLAALVIMVGARNRPAGAGPAAEEAEAGEPAGGSPDGGPPDGGPPDGGLRDVFTDARLWRIIPATFFLVGTILSFQGLWAGPYLFDVLRLDEVQAGNVLLTLGAGATVGYSISGVLGDRFGLGRMIAVAITLFALSQVALALHPPLWAVTALYALFGFTGGFNVMLMAHTRRLFPLSMTGKAVTAVNLFGIGGTFVLQWWLGVLIGFFPRDAAGHYPPEAYTAALLFTAVGTGLGLLWYLPLARKA